MTPPPAPMQPLPASASSQPPRPSTPGPRYAIYWAPPSAHPLSLAGSRWLGRDAETGRIFGNFADRADPRRYGFHATLKPPFALPDGIDESQLLAALGDFASKQAAFAMPRLQAATLGRFVALRPANAHAHDPASPLRQLADACVRDFDAFRRPATPQEIARRLSRELDLAQRANLQRWGYPHVFESWRFHMTLTDSLHAAMTAGDGEVHRLAAVDRPPRVEHAAGPDTDDRLQVLLHEAALHFAEALAAPLRCDTIALFVEPAPGADFRLQQRFGFAR